MQTLAERSGFLRFLAEPEPLLAKKWEDLRFFCSLMFIMPAIIGVSHWVWDYVTDPIGARDTFWLRLLFLSSLTFPFAFKYIKSRHLLTFASVVFGLIGLFVYVLILNRIHNGMIYGIGGFTFFLFIPLLMFQGFSVRVNIFSTFIYAAFPQLLAVIGISEGFLHAQYAVLIWPAALAMMLAHYAFAHNYRIRYESEVSLERISNTDPLTGVSNRRHFMQMIRKELTRSQRFKPPISLIVLDIDNFKTINDRYGHSAGDAVICALANICRITARQIDIVARLGGDEFAILLLEVDGENALTIAERIRTATANSPIKSFRDQEISFTVSVGVAEQPLENNSEEWLIERADAAMYQAKVAGRNRIMASAPPSSQQYVEQSAL